MNKEVQPRSINGLRVVNSVVASDNEPYVESIVVEEYVGIKAIPITRGGVEITFFYPRGALHVTLDIPTALRLQRHVCEAVCDVMKTGVCMTEAGYQEQLDRAGVDAASHLEEEQNKLEGPAK